MDAATPSISGTMATAAAIAKLPRLDAQNRPNMEPILADMRDVICAPSQRAICKKDKMQKVLKY
jgi:hypothetical protein